MLKSKDFYYKDVFDISGKKLGIVEDILLDFKGARVLGIKLSNYSFKRKEREFVKVEDILIIDEDIIVKKNSEIIGLSFREIRDMEVIDKENNTKGIVDDVIFDEEEYTLKGLIISGGIIEKIIHGKEILLFNQCLLGEDYILYSGCDGITLKTFPRNIREDELVKKA